MIIPMERKDTIQSYGQAMYLEVVLSEQYNFNTKQSLCLEGG